MVLISSLYLFRDARSWPDKVHDAWMLLGLAPGWPLAWPWLALGLALAGPWPGPGWPLAWPLAGPWPGPGWPLAWPLAGPWLALGLNFEASAAALGFKERFTIYLISPPHMVGQRRNFWLHSGQICGHMLDSWQAS